MCKWSHLGNTLYSINFEMTTAWRHSPETILQLIVIGWKDFPGDSAGLGGCPWGTILQLDVIGWKAELLWEPKVTLSLALGRVGVRSPAGRPELCPPADLPISTFLKPKNTFCYYIWSNRASTMHTNILFEFNLTFKLPTASDWHTQMAVRIKMRDTLPFSSVGSCDMGEGEGPCVGVRELPEMGLDALGVILDEEGWGIKSSPRESLWSSTSTTCMKQTVVPVKVKLSSIGMNVWPL